MCSLDPSSSVPLGVDMGDVFMYVQILAQEGGWTKGRYFDLGDKPSTGYPDEGWFPSHLVGPLKHQP